MAPAPAMQRKAIRRTVVAVRAGRTLALLCRLATGNERRQPIDVLIVRRLGLRLARLELLLRLGLRLLARVVWLGLRLLHRFARRERLAADDRLLALAIVIAIVLHIAAQIARLLLLIIRLGLAKLFLRTGDQAEIMLGVLIIVFGRYRIA